MSAAEASNAAGLERRLASARQVIDVLVSQMGEAAPRWRSVADHILEADRRRTAAGAAPAEFRHALRSGVRGQAVTVPIDGRPIVVVSSGAGLTDPDATDQAWAEVRDVVANAPATPAGTTALRRELLPPQCAALAWCDGDGIAVVTCSATPRPAAARRALQTLRRSVELFRALADDQRYPARPAPGGCPSRLVRDEHKRIGGAW